MQAPESIVDPKKPTDVQDFAKQTSRAVNGELSFGYPVDPDTEDVNAANGRKDNMVGSWVVLDLVAADFFVQGVSAGVAIACQHNLGLSIAGTAILGVETMPNVIWNVWGCRSLATCGPITLRFQHGDALTEDMIELRASAGDDAPTAMRLVVWFQPVPPW
jgi:hypothetical protein